MLTEPLPDIAANCLAVATWGVSGAPVPPPPIIKQIALGCYVRGSRYRRFIETGTYLGHTTQLIASLGVDIDTIELSKLLYGINCKDFENEPLVRCHHGNSAEILVPILRDLDVPAVFWLDGHYSGGNTALGEKVTPIAEELSLLREHPIRNHIVIVDDMRGFGVNGYPSAEWVCEIGRQIVPDAVPRLLNDSMIFASCEQHAAAEALHESISRHFIANAPFSKSDLSLGIEPPVQAQVYPATVPPAEDSVEPSDDRRPGPDAERQSCGGAEVCEVRRAPHIPPGFAHGCSSLDEVISRVFEIIGFGERTLVDAGIGDSWHDGIVHRMFWQRGWRAIHVEHTARSVTNLESIFSKHEGLTDTKVIHRALNYPDDACVLDEIISNATNEARLDLLGLRLRGPEWQALEALKHRPRVVVALFNPSIPACVEYVQEDGPNVHKGASLLALQMLMDFKGYDLVYVGQRAVFVDREEAGALEVKDHSLDVLWDGGEWQSRVMVSFDGSLAIGGNRRLLWNRLGEGRISFDQEDLQVLFRNFRRLVW